MSGQRQVTLLVIDDNEGFLDVIHKYFKLHAIDCVLANRGAQGIQLFLNAPQTYDAVLLDIHLPDMDGETVLREIRQSAQLDSKRIPVIAMSGSMREQKNSDFDFVMNKPFSLGDLLQAVCTVLEEDIYLCSKF